MSKTLEWIFVTWSIYRRVFARAAVLAAKNWPVLGSVFVYAAMMSVATLALLPFGIAGGLVMTVVQAACVGSFLYLVEMIVRTSKVTWSDFRHSFGAYVWDVLAVMFLLWIVALLRPAIAQAPQGDLLVLCLYLALFVVLNVVPELIYLGHYNVMALLSESYEFIGANWIEWFPANVAVAALIYAVMAVPTQGAPAALVQAAVVALAVYYAMVMRGLLFLELYGSTHRGRAFKYRVGDWNKL